MQTVSTSAKAASSVLADNINSTAANDTQEQIKLRLVTLCNKHLTLKLPKGMTRSLVSMNDRDKLINAIRAEYKSMLGQARGEKLDDSINSLLITTLDACIETHLSRAINATNFHSIRSSFNVKLNAGIVNEKVTAVGYNILTIKEQLLGAKLFKGQLQRRLDERSKTYPSDDKSIVSLVERIEMAEMLIAKLENEIVQQTALIK